MRRIVALAAALAAASWLMVACGSDGSGGELACGEGTVEVDGLCMPVGTGDVVQGDTAPSDVPAGTLACGPGTVEVDGECVVDEDAAADLLKPEIASVAVTALTIAEEGVRPIYPLHPLNASITLALETWDAVDTTVVLGLEKADGSARCTVGYWPLVTTGRVQDDEADPVASVTLNAEFFVQPDCDALVGETDVKAWVAFDPFDHTNLAGRTLTVDADSTLADYLQQSRLSLEGCTSETEAHPESCETALEIQASPGRDVVMTSSKLSSTVAVLELPAFVPEYTETTMTDDEGNVVDLVQPEPVKPLSTSPHFIVNADLKVFGLDGSEGDAVEDGALSLNFAIRPLVLSADETDLPLELRDWMPLFAEVQDEPRAGEEPTINLLEEEFMKSMVGSQALVRTSPIFITGDAEFVIGRGSWADFDQFEVRVCVAADFAEAGVDEDATANNCVITPVVVLRKAVTDNPVMGEEDDEVAAATYTDGIRLGDTYGNPDKVAVQFALRGELISASDGVAAGALLGSYLLGWFEMTLFEGAVRGWDYFATGTPDKIIPSLIVFGLTFPTRTPNFPVGDTELAGVSYTLSSPSVRYGWDFGIIFVGVSAHAEGTIGVGAFLNRQVMATAETNPKCSATGAVAIGTQYCVKAFNSNKTVSAAAEACRNDSGWLASAYSTQAATAIGQARTAAGVTNAYVWVDGGSTVSCVETAAMYESQCATMRDIQLSLARVYPQLRTQLEQQAQEVYDRCMARNARELEQCAAMRADLNSWKWRMPAQGSVVTSGLSFAAGQPDDAGTGQSVLALHSSGQFYDMAKGSSLPYVCMYPKSYTAGGKVSAVVEPYATLTLVGEASVSVLLASATLWVSVDLLTAALPLTGSVQWMSGSPILTLATGTLEFVLRGLGGAIGVTLWAVGAGSWTVTIFDWDSIDYGRWTLGSLIPQWRSQ